MKTLIAILSLAAPILASGSALAHVGHLGEVAGHGHWIAAGALGAAALAAWLAGKGKRPAEDADTDEEPEQQEAEA